jgi:hypothetical protein
VELSSALDWLCLHLTHQELQEAFNVGVPNASTQAKHGAILLKHSFLLYACY